MVQKSLPLPPSLLLGGPMEFPTLCSDTYVPPSPSPPFIWESGHPNMKNFLRFVPILPMGFILDVTRPLEAYIVHSRGLFKLLLFVTKNMRTFTSLVWLSYRNVLLARSPGCSPHDVSIGYPHSYVLRHRIR